MTKVHTPQSLTWIFTCTCKLIDINDVVDTTNTICMSKLHDHPITGPFESESDHVEVSYTTKQHKNLVIEFDESESCTLGTSHLMNLTQNHVKVI